ncbi:lipoate--protein ligase family protein [Paracoccus methylarcula]|uniref:Lipoate--protein ligase family protein n=1 Tax=Paracoccus methylarcula TaxID=72022 RepID=A0A3R7LG81_9RHOB|nr:lipoate--protein ligase family protein [Paracoccus methylarcula]RNF32867.1 lipoate--protein ligase family protein [Paracoccus methylarcula]
MKPWHFEHVAEGLAVEEEALSEGVSTVFTWTAHHSAIVVPRAWTRRKAIADAVFACANSGWPVLTRASGGGAVPQGAETVNLAIIAPASSGLTLEAGYELICGAIHEALRRFDIASETGAVPGALCDGMWNVTVGGRKLAGTAQRRRAALFGPVALIHAAIFTNELPESLWPVLTGLHEAAGQPIEPNPAAHIHLGELLPSAAARPMFAGALVRAAEERLKPWRGTAERAA